MLSTLKVIALAALATSAFAIPAGETGTSSVSRWDPKNLFNPGWQFPSEDELRGCVNTAAKKLGIDQIKETDPALLREILEKDMHLDKQPDIAKLLEPVLAKPQPLTDMLSKVRDGLTLHKHHPVIGMSICAALEDPKIAPNFQAADPARAAMIKRTINHAFLLETIVTEFTKDNGLLGKLKEYVDKTLTDMTNEGRSSWFPMLNRFIAMFQTAGWFGVSKDATVKMAIDRIFRLRNLDKISWLDVQASRLLLSANIAEATATDLTSKHMDNYHVGVKLTLVQPNDVAVDTKDKKLQYGVTDDWARLYETWNLAFITGNLHFMNILLPKLLIPVVLLTNGPTYMYTRAMALWLSVNFYLIAGLQKASPVQFEGQDAYSRLLGAMNLKYKDYLVANKKLDMAPKAAK
jgi:hypothetical protein